MCYDTVEVQQNNPLRIKLRPHCDPSSTSNPQPQTLEYKKVKSPSKVCCGIHPRSPSFNVESEIHEDAFGVALIVPSHLPPQSFNFELEGRRGIATSSSGFWFCCTSSGCILFCLMYDGVCLLWFWAWFVVLPCVKVVVVEVVTVESRRKQLPVTYTNYGCKTICIILSMYVIQLKKAPRNESVRIDEKQEALLQGSTLKRILLDN